MIVAFITHERLAYTKKALRSLFETAVLPMHVVVVDNASTDGTQEWLQEYAKDQDFTILLSKENRYPGWAANAAWQYGISNLNPDAEYLVRIDNDLELLPGWDTETVKVFEAMPMIGQVGLMNNEQSYPEGENQVLLHVEGDAQVNRLWTNIGGCMAYRRELWEMGLRYNETPWYSDPVRYPGGTPQEDVALSLAIRDAGYFFGNLIPRVCTEMSYGETDNFYDYHVESFTKRGHAPPPRTKGGVVIDNKGKPVSGTLGSAVDHI